MRYYFLSKHQYKFRKNRSTEHAIIEFTEGTTKAVVEGKYSAGVFLDLLKAFDIIIHRILRKKSRTLWYKENG